MADRRISELTNITGADVDDDNDELAIVDASEGQTKAITRKELLKDIVGKHYESRADFVLDVGNTYVPDDGTVVSAEGLFYVAESTANGISDLPGWKIIGGSLQSDLTLNIPIDFATLQDAVDEYSPVRPSGHEIILNIESGHVLSSGIYVENGDFGYFRITSDDAVVSAAEDFGGNDLVKGVNAIMPTLDCLVEAFNPATSSGIYTGYYALGLSKGFVTAGSGVRYCWATGCRAYQGATIKADGADFQRAAQNGTTTSGIQAWGAYISAEGANANNSGYYGVQAAHGGILSFKGGSSDYAHRYGVRVTDGGLLDADGARAIDCGVEAIRAFNLGIITARNFLGTGAGSRGVSASGASLVHARNGDFSGAGVNGIYSTTGSTVDAYDANAQMAASPDVTDFVVSSGGAIVLSAGSTGGTSQTPNATTSSGTIYNSDIEENEEFGTWTPEVTFGIPGDLSLTYSTQIGRYIRQGRMVTVTFELVTSNFSHTTGSGSLRITGLPFAPVDVSDLRWNGSLSVSGIDKSGYTHYNTEILDDSNRIFIRASGNAVSKVLITASDTPSGGTLALSGTITYYKAL